MKKLEEQEAKLEEIYTTVRKIKLYFLTMLILSVVTFVIPLIGLMFAIPWLFKTLSSTYQGLL